MMTVYQSVQVVVLVGLMYFALKAHDVTKGPDFLCHCFLFSGEAAKFDPTFKGPMRNRWMCLVSCWLFAAVRLLWFLNPQSVWLQGFMCVLCGLLTSLYTTWIKITKFRLRHEHKLGSCFGVSVDRLFHHSRHFDSSAYKAQTDYAPSKCDSGPACTIPGPPHQLN